MERGWRAVRHAAADAVRPERLLMALKTAIAVGLAWPLAQLLPGTVDDYSYYAPLGALISMMPTLMSSLRASVQTVLGLAAGIGLAWAVMASPLPGVISVPLAVGVGVVVGGLRTLGAGRDYVPIAALFVLIIGGTQADTYSVGYLVQMGVGMAVGIAVNLLIVPPLRLDASASQITALRLAVADNLDDMSEALIEEWPPQHTEWFDGVEQLRLSIRSAEPVIEEARESRRANPRARWHRYDIQEDFDDHAAIGRLGSHCRDLGEIIAGSIWSEPVDTELPEEFRAPLSTALARTAALVRAWDRREGEADALHDAEDAVSALAGAPPSAVIRGDGSAAAIAFTLKRMLAVIAGRLEAPPA